jgi:hypothetical protein
MQVGARSALTFGPHFKFGIRFLKPIEMYALSGCPLCGLGFEVSIYNHSSFLVRRLNVHKITGKS